VPETRRVTAHQQYEFREFRGHASSEDIILNSGGKGLCLTLVKPRTTSPGDSTLVQAVNARTLAPGRSAPADFKNDAEREALVSVWGLHVSDPSRWAGRG
jgi:hypothetical protein